jgi:DUF4097 and DUF4098 domain-containing protein YvlB
VIGGGSLSATVVTPRQEFRRTIALAADGRVEVENLYGDVRITGWDRDEVQVEAVKSGPGRLEEARIVVDSSSGRVSIRTHYAGAGEQPANVEYRINVPRKASLKNVKLGNGGLSLHGLAGAVKASAVNGDIKAERLEGQTELSTVNGRMEVGFERLSRANPISLSTVNGPIDVLIPSGAGATVEAQNVSGGIRAELKRVWRALDGHRLRATVNRGGARIQVKNVNGEISIRAANT